MQTVGKSAIVSLGISACICAGCSTGYSRSVNIALKSYSGVVVSDCSDVVSDVRRAVADAKMSDAESRPIHGFPYLRINRFLAHFGKRFRSQPSGAAFEAWVDRLRAADAEAIRLEITNLPTGKMLPLGKRIFGRVSTRGQIIEAANECAERQRSL